MTTDLLRCPFCSSSFIEENQKGDYVFCVSCGARGPFVYENPCKSWNTRVKSNNWIKCSDKLPEIGKDVLLWLKDEDVPKCIIFIGYKENDHWIVYDAGIKCRYELQDIIHWQYLPEAPEDV